MGGNVLISMTATLVAFISLQLESATIREVANALNRDDSTFSRRVHKLRERLKESTNLQERLKELNLKMFS